MSLTEKILIPFGKTTQSEQNKDAFSFNQTQKTSDLVEVGESIAGEYYMMRIEFCIPTVHVVTSTCT